MLPGITGKSTLSAIAHKKHSNSLLFRAVGKHSCCPKYYRKIICIIHLGGPLPVFDYLFLERLSHSGHHDFCSGCQVGRRVSSTLPSSPSSPPFSLFWHPWHSLSPGSCLRWLRLCMWEWKRYFKLGHFGSHLHQRHQKNNSLGFKLHHFWYNKAPMGLAEISRIREKNRQH